MATKPRTKQNDQERDALLKKIKKDFDDRLERLAADPAHWVEFIEQVATFGARYGLDNQLLLMMMMQAEDRGIVPRFFLPAATSRARAAGWRNGVKSARARSRSRSGRRSNAARPKNRPRNGKRPAVRCAANHPGDPLCKSSDSS
jgi:hypothetical protein